MTERVRLLLDRVREELQREVGLGVKDVTDCEPERVRESEHGEPLVHFLLCSSGERTRTQPSSRVHNLVSRSF